MRNEIICENPMVTVRLSEYRRWDDTLVPVTQVVRSFAACAYRRMDADEYLAALDWTIDRMAEWLGLDVFHG